MGDGDTIETEFQIAIECENLAAAVYREFKEKFAHVPEIEEFWNDMIEDEKKHARYLEEIFNSLTSDQLSGKADPDLLRELRAILELKLEDVTGPVETLDEAYEVANKLENSEVNTAFRLLMNGFISAETRKKAIMNTLEIHLGRLIKFSDNYGDSEWRKSIAAKV
jgi:rubrerythrin